MQHTMIGRSEVCGITLYINMDAKPTIKFDDDPVFLAFGKIYDLLIFVHKYSHVFKITMIPGWKQIVREHDTLSVNANVLAHMRRLSREISSPGYKWHVIR